MIVQRWVLLVGTTASALATVACGDGFSASDCKASRTCVSAGGNSGSSGKGAGGGAAGSHGGGTSNAGGSSGSSGSAGEGGECEGDVSDDAACWTTNAYGVFVSSEHGDDATGNGTKEAPFKSITKGLSAASGKKVFVCLGPSGDYTDALKFDGAEDVSIYGGFECENWEYSTTRKAGIKPATNIAVRINKSKNLTFENLRIVAADATGSGYDASSYGAFVTESEGVLFRRVELTAGNGAKGADGEDGGTGAAGAVIPIDEPPSPKGKPAICSSPPATQPGGAWTAQSACGSLGGAGGRGRSDVGQPGGSGDPGAPSRDVVEPGLNNAGAGAVAINAKGTGGTDGAQGLPGTLGEAAPAFGEFAGQGFSPANGGAGGKGHVGQGGGGGGASKGNGMCVAASGGAGGMGGCGGDPGGAGAGGGASVGLFAWDSAILLANVVVSGSTGGAGGRGGQGGGGGAGGEGASGGAGDQANGIGAGGLGGAGGPGGNGGSGAGGTGGPSIGIVFHGSPPAYAQDSEIRANAGGRAGRGGKVLVEAAPDGAEGASAKELVVE